MIICKYCSKENPENSYYCQNCGRPLEQTTSNTNLNYNIINETDKNEENIQKDLQDMKQELLKESKKFNLKNTLINIKNFIINSIKLLFSMIQYDAQERYRRERYRRNPEFIILDAVEDTIAETIHNLNRSKKKHKNRK